MRDSQRQKVYDAEAETEHGKRFTTVKECQIYVDRVLARKRLQTKLAKRVAIRITVHPGHGHRQATASFIGRERVIQAPIWARTELTLLHEIAHHVVGLSHHHDWEFCRVLLILVREMLGAETERHLKAGYRARKVRFAPPRTRQLTPAQREAAVARLAAAREARAGERGRWALKHAHQDLWYKKLTWKYGHVHATLTSKVDDATVWTTKAAVDRWIERLDGDGWGYDLVDLSHCSVAVR
jgi:putative metallohydrolase (TIGR04338 family)